MQKFSICVICTGNELLDGRVLNSNIIDISHHLQGIGLSVHHCSIVSDDFLDLVNTVKRHIKEHQCVIITGGLGPTDDDRTTEAVSKATGLPLKKNKEAFEDIVSFFKARKKDMSPNNEKQSYFPKGASIIKNMTGTAPGYSLKTASSYVVSLPGVPIELNNMFNNTLTKRLHDEFKASSTKHYSHTWSCYGKGESSLAQMIQHLYPLPKGSDILYRATHPVVHITLKATDLNKQSKKTFEQLKSGIHSHLAPYLFSETKETMEQSTLSNLQKHKLTLALAESCTGGMIASMITACPGASKTLLQGVVCYSNEAKQNLLQVPKQVIEKHGAVSKEVAKYLAEGSVKTSGASIGVGITGIAGPDGGTKKKPVGTVFIGINFQGKTSVVKHVFHGQRQIIQKKAAYEVLFRLLNLKK